MEYFYIMSSVASLVSLIGSFFVLYRKSRSRILAINLFSGFSVLTVFFWLWFYFVPGNPAKEVIADRSTLVETYTDGKDYIDVVQGQIEFSTYKPRSVFFPLFRSPPEITFVYRGSGAPYDPTCIEVTKDKLTVRVDNSAQLGTWSYRARGELLRKVK